MKLGELFFELGFKSDHMKLKDFGKAVSELNMSSILSAGSFGAMIHGAKELISMADEMAHGVNKFGRETGQSREEIQKWSMVAEQMGASSDSVISSVETLQDSLFKMKFTGEGSNIWNMLGLDPTHTQNMFEVLDMLRERLKGVSTEEQRFFLQSLGLRTELLNIFKMTDEEWKNIGNQLHFNNEQLDEMEEYHKQMISHTQKLKAILSDLGVSMAPLAKGLMDVANSIDDNILKSWQWKNLMTGIGDFFIAAAHPIKTFGDAFRDTPKLWENFRNELNGPGVNWLRDRLENESPAAYANVNMKLIVQSNDPHTNAKIYQENHEKSISDVVHSNSGGSW